MKYLKVFTDFAGSLSELGEAEIGRLFMAMLKYAETSELPDLRGNERFVWPTAKSHIDRAMKECARQSENGKKGGRKKPKETQINPNKPTESLKDKDKDKEKKDKSITPFNSSPRKFAPPTVEDVRAYCKERGNKVDGQTFVDFYSSKGWKVGNQPMKDWKAAVRTWEQRDEKPTRKGNAGNHSQRKYSADDLKNVGRDLLEDV